MQALIIAWIASSIENGVLKQYFLKALRILSAKTSNTVDDNIVSLIEHALNNEKIDGAVKEALAKGVTKVASQLS
jgi:hypothetical protein